MVFCTHENLQVMGQIYFEAPLEGNFFRALSGKVLQTFSAFVFIPGWLLFRILNVKFYLSGN